MSELLDIHDSEIIRLEAVKKALMERQATVVNLEAFRKEAIERFAQAGFDVFVQCYETDQVGAFAFDIDILGRIEGDFDPDRQVHEVTNDLLELGEGGVIKVKNSSSGLIVPGHGHSH